MTIPSVKSTYFSFSAFEFLFLSFENRLVRQLHSTSLLVLLPSVRFAIFQSFNIAIKHSFFFTFTIFISQLLNPLIQSWATPFLSFFSSVFGTFLLSCIPWNLLHTHHSATSSLLVLSTIPSSLALSPLTLCPITRSPSYSSSFSSRMADAFPRLHLAHSTPSMATK